MGPKVTHLNLKDLPGGVWYFGGPTSKLMVWFLRDLSTSATWFEQEVEELFQLSPTKLDPKTTLMQNLKDCLLFKAISALNDESIAMGLLRRELNKNPPSFPNPNSFPLRWLLNKLSS